MIIDRSGRLSASDNGGSLLLSSRLPGTQVPGERSVFSAFSSGLVKTPPYCSSQHQPRRALSIICPSVPSGSAPWRSSLSPPQLHILPLWCCATFPSDAAPPTGWAPTLAAWERREEEELVTFWWDGVWEGGPCNAPSYLMDSFAKAIYLGLFVSVCVCFGGVRSKLICCVVSREQTWSGLINSNHYLSIRPPHFH